MAETVELGGMPQKLPNVTKKIGGTIAVKREDPDTFPEIGDTAKLSDLLMGSRSTPKVKLSQITEKADKDGQIEYVLSWTLI